MKRSGSGRLGGVALALVIVAQVGCLAPGEGGARRRGRRAVGGRGRPAGYRRRQDPPTGLLSRPDALPAYVELNPGSWGSWIAPRFCPVGAFAIGYKLRAELSTVEDKTALNAIELQCMDGQGNLSTAEAHEGLWGRWNMAAMCANTFLTGGAVRFQPSRGSNDDTGANDFRAVCGDNVTLTAKGGGAEGTWNATKSCPAGHNVCGISVRFESSQGGGDGNGEDDTALNAVRLHCCPNPTPKTRLRIVDRKDNMEDIQARTFTADTGAVQAPLILVEGFDPDGSYDVDTMPVKMPAGFMAALANIGYSVTFVDLTRNWDRIQLNALRVGELANNIWNESAKVRPLKLMGASMGGLIVTTAAVIKDRADVLDLPQPSWSFEVDHVTTLDAPRAGVYIPKALYNLFERFDHLDIEASRMSDAITSVASRQMGLIPFDDVGKTTRDAWQSDYGKILGVMRRSDIRYVGVVDGSWTGKVQDKTWLPGTLNVSFSDGSFFDPLSYWVSLFTQPEKSTVSGRADRGRLGLRPGGRERSLLPLPGDVADARECGGRLDGSLAEGRREPGHERPLEEALVRADLERRGHLVRRLAQAAARAAEQHAAPRDGARTAGRLQPLAVRQDPQDERQ